MKIEMGESLFYSWLRHVKECQIVQTNWKVSPEWCFVNIESIEEMFEELNLYFEGTYEYKIFKNNSSLTQIIKQGECDVLGISIKDGLPFYYAVDVAFHEAGLNYGSQEETVLKVLAKCIRTIFCLYGYFNTKSAEIIFASPKINPTILQNLLPLIEYINDFFKNKSLEFNIRVICNEDFDNTVLQPILLVSGDVADTSELFMRSYQLLGMFTNEKMKFEINSIYPSAVRKVKNTIVADHSTESHTFSELKIGQIARTVLKNILESGNVSDEEIAEMQTIGYSKRNFDIQYPLLVAEDKRFERVRYYSNPIIVNGNKYYLCSQWFETSANNDRPYLIRWITAHKS